ncbi:MAG: tRNA pseudouridine(55) synthase TruB [Pirellulales bacterium]|nr:tRNA pseudouridine(55) synthase TruB [Pirellulales bacterium]
MFALLNLRKPPGPTSRDVVNRVQRLVRPAKAGHAGTLDPIASGVLVVCLGQATRLTEYVQRAPKTYRATFLLGQRSPSDDVESEVELVPGAPVPGEGELTAALPRFVGTIEQRPPAFSAVKIAGRRAYDLARRGNEVKLAPRPVAIRSLRLLAYDYPRCELEIVCGSGTYVRSLGRDLAESLGTSAVMAALERTAIGPFRVEAAADPRTLTAEMLPNCLISPLEAVRDLPQWELAPAELADVACGRLLPLPAGVTEAAEFAALDPGGRLVAILRRHAAGQYKPAPNFSQP